MGFPLSDDRIVNAQNCTQESVREGLKSAAIACVLTLAAVRMIPWAKANLNHTGQALIVSGASVASYFVTSDKTILKATKKNARYERKG